MSGEPVGRFEGLYGKQRGYMRRITGDEQADGVKVIEGLLGPAY